MKDYKLPLAVLILLILIIFMGVFTWLWGNNRKNIDPLPITSSENNENEEIIDNEKNTDKLATEVLHLQAEQNLRVPLDEVIDRFEARHSGIQVIAHYVPAHLLLTLPEANGSNNQSSTSIINTDIIMADDGLSEQRLTPLQALLNDTQTKLNSQNDTADSSLQDTVTVDSMTDDDMIDDNASDETSVQNSNKQARKLVSFSYAVKGSQTVDGVILTDNSAAVSFRNFLLSSMGQDILKQYDYDNIEGYQNSLDDLFNPTSRAQATEDDNPVEVTDALSNGQ